MTVRLLGAQNAVRTGSFAARAMAPTADGVLDRRTELEAKGRTS